MGNFRALRDSAAGYVFISTADGYPFTPEWFATLRAAPFHGEYHKARRGELRFSPTQGAAAVDELRAAGHQVEATSGPRDPVRPPTPGQLPECSYVTPSGEACGQPYLPSYRPAAGELCSSREVHWDAGAACAVPRCPPHELHLIYVKT